MFGAAHLGAVPAWVFSLHSHSRMSLGTAAELDFMLRDSGELVVFADASTTYGSLRHEEVISQDEGGYQVAGSGTVLRVREGTQPASLLDGALLTVAGVEYRLRTVQPLHADGLRPLMLVRTVS